MRQKKKPLRRALYFFPIWAKKLSWAEKKNLLVHTLKLIHSRYAPDLCPSSLQLIRKQFQDQRGKTRQAIRSSAPGPVPEDGGDGAPRGRPERPEEQTPVREQPPARAARGRREPDLGFCQDQVKCSQIKDVFIL